MSKCNKCNGTFFVCENHTDQEAHQCKHCGGAGMPCECTKPFSEWISVKNRLPPIYVNVLIYDTIDNYISNSLLNENNQWIGCKSNIDDITHWMPLPEAPKES